MENPLYTDPSTLLPKSLKHKPTPKEIQEVKAIRKAYLNGEYIEFSMRYDPKTWIPLHKKSYMRTRNEAEWIKVLSEVKYRFRKAKK